MAPGFFTQKNGFFPETPYPPPSYTPNHPSISTRIYLPTPQIPLPCCVKRHRSCRFIIPPFNFAFVPKNPIFPSFSNSREPNRIPSGPFSLTFFFSFFSELLLMRLEGELVSKSSGAQLIAKKSNLSSKKGKRRQRRTDCMSTVVQRLFDACKEVFDEGTAGFVPPPEDVARIRSILDSMKPADVGLSPKLPYFRNIDASRPPPITYLHVYECHEFSIGIFCLPPSAVIPLHNHPGMTVFSKILFGSMHIKSYDWVVVSQDSIEPSCVVLPSGERLAKVKTDAVFTAPCETSILYPSVGGNMHCFTAKTACAVLDVLGPPYSIPERNCTYYYDHAYARYAGESPLNLGEGEGYSWLQERIGKPEELLVVGAKYKGPNIVEG